MRGVSSGLGRPAPFVTSYMIGRENKRTNNKTTLPALKNNAAAGYQGPVKRELLKGAGLLCRLTKSQTYRINGPKIYIKVAT